MDQIQFLDTVFLGDTAFPKVQAACPVGGEKHVGIFCDGWCQINVSFCYNDLVLNRLRWRIMDEPDLVFGGLGLRLDEHGGQDAVAFRKKDEAQDLQLLAFQLDMGNRLEVPRFVEGPFGAEHAGNQLGPPVFRRLDRPVEEAWILRRELAGNLRRRRGR